MQYTEPIDNQGLLGIIRRSCSLVDARLMDHGFRVAYIVSEMLKRHHWQDSGKLRDICFLALLHDVGAYKTDEISKMLQFETDHVLDHSAYGYLFVKYFSPLHKLAEAVLFHHITWNDLKKECSISEDIRMLAQIICVADRIDIAMEIEHLSWAEVIIILKKNSGSRFSPVVTQLAIDCDFTTPPAKSCEAGSCFLNLLSEVPFTQEEISGYLQMLIFTIDFRSRHTVTHTITTTTISGQLAKLMGLDDLACHQIVCGAQLHDLGKIGVPEEILEYPGKLSPQAMNIMRTHVDITERIFGDVIEETIKRLALRHHEKLDGSGYPKGLRAEDLTAGERIVAIADIVSALAGTRSYKDAFPRERICSIILQMKKDGLIDPDIVDVMVQNYDTIMEITQVKCQPILDIYTRIHEEYIQLSGARSLEKLAKSVQR